MPQKISKFSREGAYNKPRKNIILFLVVFDGELKYYKDEIIF
jgi:hypothetical protein